MTTGMKTLLRLEAAGLMALGVVLFIHAGGGWGWLALWFFVPDVAMIGYAAGPRIGAALYNTAHHLGIAAGLYALGLLVGVPWLQLTGAVMLAHTGFDRVWGYGLKYGDNFKHTHLGWLRGQAPAQ